MTRRCTDDDVGLAFASASASDGFSSADGRPCFLPDLRPPLGDEDDAAAVCCCSAASSAASASRRSTACSTTASRWSHGTDCSAHRASSTTTKAGTSFASESTTLANWRCGLPTCSPGGMSKCWLMAFFCFSAAALAASSRRAAFSRSATCFDVSFFSPSGISSARLRLNSFASWPSASDDVDTEPTDSTSESTSSSSASASAARRPLAFFDVALASALRAMRSCFAASRAAMNPLRIFSLSGLALETRRASFACSRDFLLRTLRPLAFIARAARRTSRLCSTIFFCTLWRWLDDWRFDLALAISHSFQ
mmetsp:Transcript_46179/g.142384  ORF Transcript_46179/g.142384 Transcript_46179/m.142384 type:complete len:309 (-) Transcript_46179:16-942(-)